MQRVHEIGFQTKPELALNMIRRAIADGVPKGVALADSAYGSSRQFREGLRELGLHYAVGVIPTTTVWRIDQDWQRDEAISVRDLAMRLRDRGRFRRCTWRKGTKCDLSAKFALERVLPAYADGERPRDREPVWLLIEWRDGEDEPANYFLSSLPERISKKRLIRIAMQRWRTERVYEDLKGELGLDHFEGRRFHGWHRHVSVALCCYAFVVAERVRRFPPRPEGRWPTTRSRSRPERHRQLHHLPPRDRARARDLAPALPDMSPATLTLRTIDPLAPVVLTGQPRIPAFRALGWGTAFSVRVREVHETFAGHASIIRGKADDGGVARRQRQGSRS